MNVDTEVWTEKLTKGSTERCKQLNKKIQEGEEEGAINSGKDGRKW